MYFWAHRRRRHLLHPGVVDLADDCGYDWAFRHFYRLVADDYPVVFAALPLLRCQQQDWWMRNFLLLKDFLFVAYPLFGGDSDPVGGDYHFWVGDSGRLADDYYLLVGDSDRLEDDYRFLVDD